MRASAPPRITLLALGALSAACSAPFQGAGQGAGQSAGQSASPPPPAPAAPEKPWDFVLTPYVWFTGQEGTVEIDGGGGATDASFGDILDSLDTGGGLALELGPRRSPLRILFDSVITRADENIRNGDVDVTQTTLEIDGAWRIGEQPGFDALFGFRYTGLDSDISFNSGGGVSAHAGWVDPIVGARASLPFGERFALDARGDVGGFGLGSRYTVQFQADLAWRPIDWFSAFAGWRYLKVDYEEHDFEYRVASTGPVVGASFRF